MNIDISALRRQDSITINEEVKIKKEEFINTEIIELKKCNVSGCIYKYGDNDYDLDLVLEGTMVLPCSITLEPVEYNFSTDIQGVYTEMMEEIENFDKKIENLLDIFPIIWENILMEIPIKVTCPEATDLKLSGDGWKLVTEESSERNISAFDKLKDLL